MFNTSSSSGGPGSATFTFVCEAGGDSVKFISSTPDPAYATPLPPAALSGTYTSEPAANSLGQALTLVVNDRAGTVAVPGGDSFTVALTVPDPGKSALISPSPIPRPEACPRIRRPGRAVLCRRREARHAY
ncbi:MAG: hypothetical protein P4L36_10400 [Holophaga sp.]|nr:hypothetical protein [Holophaga sp.]